LGPSFRLRASTSSCPIVGVDEALGCVVRSSVVGVGRRGGTSRKNRSMGHGSERASAANRSGAGSTGGIGRSHLSRAKFRRQRQGGNRRTVRSSLLMEDDEHDSPWGLVPGTDSCVAVRLAHQLGSAIDEGDIHLAIRPGGRRAPSKPARHVGCLRRSGASPRATGHRPRGHPASSALAIVSARARPRRRASRDLQSPGGSARSVGTRLR
jgi:hypothetical protein